MHISRLGDQSYVTQPFSSPLTRQDLSLLFISALRPLPLGNMLSVCKTKVWIINTSIVCVGWTEAWCPTKKKKMGILSIPISFGCMCTHVSCVSRDALVVFFDAGVCLLPGTPRHHHGYIPTTYWIKILVQVFISTWPGVDFYDKFRFNNLLPMSKHKAQKADWRPEAGVSPAM